MVKKIVLSLHANYSGETLIEKFQKQDIAHFQ